MHKIISLVLSLLHLIIEFSEERIDEKREEERERERNKRRSCFVYIVKGNNSFCSNKQKQLCCLDPSI